MFTKEEIIKKIREWSKDNGGKTPSEKNFYEYAGIGIYDLHRLGWSCYGAFVKDAGLIPNKFDKTKYSHDQLCEIFIEVIREKGMWPTRGVLDVKHLNDSNFPNSATFYNKLGLTGVLAQSILEYIKDKQRYNDIITICNLVLEKHKNKNEKECEESNENIIHGWVYLIKHGSRNEYRIGKTTNPLRRLGENRIELPEGANPIHSIETADITGVETYWLNRFKSKKMNGDWFNLNRTDISEFKRWRKIY